MNSKEYINYKRQVKEVVKDIARIFKEKNPSYSDEDLLANIIASMHREGKKLSDIKSSIYDYEIVKRYQKFKNLSKSNKRRTKR